MPEFIIDTISDDKYFIIRSNEAFFKKSKVAYTLDKVIALIGKENLLEVIKWLIILKKIL